MVNFFNLLLFLTLVFLLSLGCVNDTNVCRIIYVEGKAYQLDENKIIKKSLKNNDIINTNVTIKTDKDSYVDLEFADSSRIRIQEDSVIDIEKIRNKENQDKVKIFIELGESFAKLDNIATGDNIVFETETMVIKDKNAEFIISVSQKRVTRIAVLNGKLVYSTKLNSEELNLIRQKDMKTAAKIEEIISKDSELNANEKIDFSHDDYVIYNENINKIINTINKEIEINKSSPDKNVEIIKKYTESLDKVVSDFKEQKKEKISSDEWKKIMDSIQKGEKSLDITDDFKDKVISKDKDIINDVTKDQLKITEKEYVWKIKKVASNLGLEFSEKNTGISSGSNSLYVASNSNNALYCINPINCNLFWSFSDIELKNIFSRITLFGSNLVLGTPDKIFVLNSNGTKKYDMSISGGVTYWSQPIIANDKLYIPSTRGIYSFDGENINFLDKIINVSGQVYMSANSENLFFISINDFFIKAYNLKEEKIIWTSDKIANPVFMPPLINKGFIYIADNTGNLYKYSFQSGKSSPEILRLETGVIVNLLIKNNILYFLGNNGDFCSVDLASFNIIKKIMKIEFNPDINKFLTKSFSVLGDEIFYCSDSGGLFVYNTKSEMADLIDIPENVLKNPLISSPQIIGNVIFVLDNKSNIYKRFRDIK
ncbi:MAG TPA: FecR domain-containing protein [Spirochaetota bacterium]|nr:FecR domain-containing protein [Spirochaetota bacterium]